MKFGRVEDAASVDFSLPKDHLGNEAVFRKGSANFELYIGLPTWNRQLLKGFYPRGTKDELTYYSTQFNAIEFNATFYNFWDAAQIQDWVDRTPADFRFFPKVHRSISHERWLLRFEKSVDLFTEGIRVFGDKLGTCFLQLHEDFNPENMDRLVSFVDYWPSDLPLAIELRDGAWFSERAVADEICDLFAAKNISNVIIDTPGRRDLLHMRLTTPNVFIRFLGCGSSIDSERLKMWSERIVTWQKKGIDQAAIFLHHEPEIVTIDLARTLSEELNEHLGVGYFKFLSPTGQQQLF